MINIICIECKKFEAVCVDPWNGDEDIENPDEYVFCYDCYLEALSDIQGYLDENDISCLNGCCRCCVCMCDMYGG